VKTSLLLILATGYHVCVCERERVWAH